MSSMIGAYGEWAAGLVGDEPGRFSLRHPRWAVANATLDEWRAAARQRFHDLLLQPERGHRRDAGGTAPTAEVQHRLEYDGLEIEHLSWQLPYGPPTEAYFLKPAGPVAPASRRWPAVLALHDHGDNKYFGKRKIARISDDVHPMMRRHQEDYYGGVAWANELARRGYAVLVHDAFAFESRRVRPADVPEVIRGGLTEVDPESQEEIDAYNRWAGGHESIMAKSLFCAGTTWPGVFSFEDQRALDYLAARDDVDAERIGCCGLSGGGLRTVFLGGLDDRIRAAVCVGMMTTWRDYLLNKSHTHTWMIYVPGLPWELDYPEILGLRVPLPTLVQNDSEDQLFTLPEMQRADEILRRVYEIGGAADRYRCTFYPGPHKFDREMQAEAFEFFDQWLAL